MSGADFQNEDACKFAKQNDIGDFALVEAVGRAMRGLIDADLGGQIIEQRVARPGQGRRGGFRMLLGFRADRAVFLFGFAKNERENIDSDQLATLRDIVAPWLAADELKIDRSLTDGILIEVHDGKKRKER